MTSPVRGLSILLVISMNRLSLLLVYCLNWIFAIISITYLFLFTLSLLCSSVSSFSYLDVNVVGRIMPPPKYPHFNPPKL